MIGRLLCRIGLHRWQQKTTPLPNNYIRDVQTCRRPDCTVEYVYTTHRSDPVNW